MRWVRCALFLFRKMKLFALALSFTAVSAGVCNDKRPDCAHWAKDGECTGENAVRLPASL